jgi:hypothetical protein
VNAARGLRAHHAEVRQQRAKERPRLVQVRRQRELSPRSRGIGFALDRTHRVGMTLSTASSILRSRNETAHQIFGTNRLAIRFEISKVVMVSPTAAFDRSRSAGTATILANGARVSEGNQEFLVLVCPEDGGAWRMGRDILSTTDL